MTTEEQGKIAGALASMGQEMGGLVLRAVRAQDGSMFVPLTPAGLLEWRDTLLRAAALLVPEAPAEAPTETPEDEQA